MKDNFIDISLSYEAYIARKGLLEAIRYAAPRYMKGRLCDLGCGVKPYEPILKPYVSEYVGVDEKAQATLHSKSSTKADVWSDCASVPLPEESFDTLFSTQTLEHVPDPGKVVREISRLLVSGGHAVVTVPFCWSVHAPPHDYQRLTEFGLKRLFEEAGFKTLEIRPCQGMYAAIKQLEIIHLKHIRGASMRNKYWSFPLRNLLAQFFDKKRDTTLCLDYLGVFRKP